jgi:hypothetical protein
VCQVTTHLPLGLRYSSLWAEVGSNTPVRRRHAPFDRREAVQPYDPERIYLDLNHLFNADEETIARLQKAAVAAEVLKIIRKAGLATE